jgi:tetratricopeptide (TPR) repeat protein
LHKAYAKAIDFYEHALRIDNHFASCMISKGILHCSRGELKQGHELFLKASQILPGSAIAFHLLARVEKQMGLKAESRLHE